MKTFHRLADAKDVADILQQELGRKCYRITIAGSVRREQAQVGDVELVCIPKVVTTYTGLFGDIPVHQDLLEDALLDAIEQGTLDYRLNEKGHRTFGHLNKCLVHTESGIPVDVFSTVYRFWGMTLFIRTGPKELNIKAMKRLRALGMRGHAYGGISGRYGEDELDCPDENTVYRLLGWPYRDPWERV